MSTLTNAQSTSDEARIQLAIQAIDQDPTLSERRAAAIYNVPWKMLSDWRAGKVSRRDCKPKLKKLLETKEQVII
jgi:DNA-binding transcriptional regulator YiaG